MQLVIEYLTFINISLILIKKQRSFNEASQLCSFLAFDKGLEALPGVSLGCGGARSKVIIYNAMDCGLSAEGKISLCAGSMEEERVQGEERLNNSK